MRNYITIINENQEVDEGLKGAAAAVGLGAMGLAAMSGGSEAPEPEVAQVDNYGPSDPEDTVVRSGTRNGFNFVYFKANEQALGEVLVGGEDINVWTHNGTAMNEIKDATVHIKDGVVFVAWKGQLGKGFHSVDLGTYGVVNLRVN